MPTPRSPSPLHRLPGWRRAVVNVIRLGVASATVSLVACGGGGCQPCQSSGDPADLALTSSCDGHFDALETPLSTWPGLKAGSTVSCPLTLENLDSRSSQDLQLNLQLAPGLRWSGLQCQAEGGARCPDAAWRGGTLPALPAGAQLRLTLHLDTPASATTAAPLHSQAQLRQHGASIEDATHSPSAALRLTLSQADLQLQADGAPQAPAQAGGAWQLPLRLHNAGPDPVFLTPAMLQLQADWPLQAQLSSSQDDTGQDWPAYVNRYGSGWWLGVGQSMRLRWQVAAPPTHHASPDVSVQLDEAGDPAPANNHTTLRLAPV